MHLHLAYEYDVIKAAIIQQVLSVQPIMLSFLRISKFKQVIKYVSQNPNYHLSHTYIFLNILINTIQYSQYFNDWCKKLIYHCPLVSEFVWPYLKIYYSIKHIKLLNYYCKQNKIKSIKKQIYLTYSYIRQVHGF